MFGAQARRAGRGMRRRLEALARAAKRPAVAALAGPSRGAALARRAPRADALEVPGDALPVLEPRDFCRPQAGHEPRQR